MRQCTVAMSFAFVSEGISPDTSLSLKSVAHLKNKKNPQIEIPARSPSRQRDVGLWHHRYIYQTGNHLHGDCREKRCSNPTTNHRESGTTWLNCLLRRMACLQTDSAETNVVNMRQLTIRSTSSTQALVCTLI